MGSRCALHSHTKNRHLLQRCSSRERRPLAVILSEAGRHGRSRRTSNVRGFSRGASVDYDEVKLYVTPWTLTVPWFLRAEVLHPAMRWGCSDIYLCSAREPADIRGPSTAPM